MLRPNGAGGTSAAPSQPPPITDLLDASATTTTAAGITSTIDNKIKLITNNNDDGRRSKHTTNTSGNSSANPKQTKVSALVDAAMTDDDTDDDGLSEDPGIKSLLEISLPSPVMTNHEGEFLVRWRNENKTVVYVADFLFLMLSIEEFVYSNHPPMSPMGIIRESPTDPKWFEENLSDFSLSSFLGHLDSECGTEKGRQPRDVSIYVAISSKLLMVDWKSRY